MKHSIQISLFLCLLSVPAAAMDVTTCGQVVPDNEVGVMRSDVVCTVEPVGVTLGKGATLKMAGFDLLGGTGIGVLCSTQRCAVTGPGVIDGTWIGIKLDERVRLDLTDVTVRNGKTAITAGTALGQKNKIVMENVVLEDSTTFAVIAKRIRATNVVVARNASLGDISIHGIKFRGDNVTVTDNGGFGLTTKSAKIKGFTATGNFFAGVVASRRLVLQDSTVADNDTGLGGVADIVSGKFPKLTNTVCGTSSGGLGTTWGVCVND